MLDDARGRRMAGRLGQAHEAIRTPLRAFGRRAPVLLASLLLATGCVPRGHGWASLYKPAQSPKIQVAMPENAPSISQQFLFTTNDAKHLASMSLARPAIP